MAMFGSSSRKYLVHLNAPSILAQLWMLFVPLFWIGLLVVCLPSLRSRYSVGPQFFFVSRAAYITLCGTSVADISVSLAFVLFPACR